MGKIKKISEKESTNSAQRIEIYPVTSTKAVYDTSNKVLDDYIQHLKKTSTFAGVATPTTDPGTPDGNVFYIAGEGTYVNFSGLSVGMGELAVLKWNGTWSKQTIKVGLPTNELNISNIYKTQGIGGTNKYTLEGAIAQVPAKNRVQGLKVSFINESGDTEVWEYTGSSWKVGKFSEVGARKIFDIEQSLGLKPYFTTNTNRYINLDNDIRSNNNFTIISSVDNVVYFYNNTVQVGESVKLSANKPVSISLEDKCNKLWIDYKADTAIFLCEKYLGVIDGLGDSKTNPISQRAVSELNDRLLATEIKTGLLITKLVTNDTYQKVEPIIEANREITIISKDDDKLYLRGLNTGIVVETFEVVAGKPYHKTYDKEIGYIWAKSNNEVSFYEGRYEPCQLTAVDELGQSSKVVTQKAITDGILSQLSKADIILYSAVKVINIDTEKKIIELPPYFSIRYGNTIKYFSNSDIITIDISSATTNYAYALFYNSKDDSFSIVQVTIGAKINNNLNIYYCFSFYIKGKDFAYATLPINMYTINNEYIDVLRSSTNVLYYNKEYIWKQILLQMTCPYLDWSSSSVPTPPLALIAFSDIHGEFNSVVLKDIKIFYNKFYSHISDIISLGDQCTAGFGEDFSWWEKSGGENVLLTIGNHDTPYQLENNQKGAYDKFIKPFINNWGVVSPGENVCYYYKDYSINKVRLIVLDCMNYDENQQSWLVNILNEAKNKGLSVVIAAHYTYGKIVNISESCKWSCIDYTLGTINDQKLKNIPVAVNDFITNGGDFVCYIRGHEHYDYIGYSEEYPNQIHILIGWAGIVQGGRVDSMKVDNTKTRDEFTIFAVDTYSKLIKLAKVGNNIDRYMRKKEFFCINYSNKNIYVDD